MRNKVAKILENYNTNISSKNLNLAFQKVDEVKNMAGRTVMKMAENMREAEKMLENS